MLCLHKPDVVVSSMVLGNPDPFIEVRAYPNEALLKQIITEFVGLFEETLSLIFWKSVQSGWKGQGTKKKRLLGSVAMDGNALNIHRHFWR